MKVKGPGADPGAGARGRWEIRGHSLELMRLN